MKKDYGNACEKRFSRTNPPPEEATALERIDVLNTRAALLETQLEHTCSADFRDETAYRQWRQRAVGALGYVQSEIRFLIRWVKKSRGAAGERMVDVLAEEARQIQARARLRAEEISKDYLPVFSKSSRPTTYATAKERDGHLDKIIRRLQVALEEITGEWGLCVLPPSGLRAAKKPLTEILMTVEAEASVVRRYLKKNSAPTVEQEAQRSRLIWRSCCLAALTRAMESGFVLTEDEMFVYDAMRKHEAKDKTA